MPSSIESSDYELFDYKHFDESPLTLDEAVKEAAKLRTTKADLIHRIVPIDSNLSGFRVQSTPREAVYMDFLGHWTQLLSRFITKR